MKREKTGAIFARAKKVLPNGVASNFRYWGDDKTMIASRAKGSYVWDADDNRYIDYRLGFGPIILGHGYDPVDQHVAEAASNGIIYSFTTEREVRVAEKMAEMCPAIEVMRFSNSGTEATMHALRVARAYTGREKVVKFEGQYHGMHDYLIWSSYNPVESMGSRRSPIPVVTSSGVPSAIRDLIITVPYNDFEGLERVFKRSWHEIAAIVVEAILGNCAAVEPEPGFLEHIRKLCDEYGVVFILDEVKTGFRVARGGAQELFNIKPDMAAYAKSLGNGYPVAAFGGKREIMEMIGNGVSHAGTYNGNSVGVAAAEKVLEIVSDPQVLKSVADRGRQLQQGLSDILEKYGLPFVFNGHPSMFALMIGEHKPKDYREWRKHSNPELYEEIVYATIQRGALPDYDPREPWFMCYAHSEQDVAETLTAFEDAVKEVTGA